MNTLMNKKIIKQFSFDGFIQDNLDKYLEASITFHFDDIDDKVMIGMFSYEKLAHDIGNIIANAFGSDFDIVVMPDSSRWFYEDLELAVYQKIQKIYN